jgi:hypothetical protein
VDESLSMAVHRPRLFADDDEIRFIGEGLLSKTLPRAKWTHEAHLAACCWILKERTEIAAVQEMPNIIRAYNTSVGGVNDDTQGYHETITQSYILVVKRHLDDSGEELGLVDIVNALLLSEQGDREWLLHFYSKELLFSAEARRVHISPDLAELF